MQAGRFSVLSGICHLGEGWVLAHLYCNDRHSNILECETVDIGRSDEPP